MSTEQHRSHARNPVSLRLYKVLGANYEDQATHDALLTLSKLYAPSGVASELTNSHWQAQPAAGRIPPTSGSLTGDTIPEHAFSMPKLPGNSAARARKNLRRDLETRLADGSRRYLKAFQAVDEKLDVLESFILDMHKQCDDAESQLKTTNEACASLLSRANGLRAERREVEQRQAVIVSFLQRFTLSIEEAEALTSRDVIVGETVFMALKKTEQIRDECTLLLSGEEEGSRAGLDIMSQTSSQLDQGYQKLHRWCSSELRKRGSDAYPEVSQTLQTAMVYLRKRPELLEDSLNVLAETRQSTVLQTFLTALTRGGPDGVPRPMEIHAHDPVRYVGDMLAWIHQAIAWEHEFLERLFGSTSSQRMVGSVRTFNEESSDPGTDDIWSRRLMDAAVVGLCKPLKHRVVQTVKSQEGTVVAYRIANLLQFYSLTMTRTIGEQAVLCLTLKELFDTASDVFFELVEAQGRSVLRFLHPPQSDLAPPLTLLDSAHILRETMSVYESSLIGDEDEDDKAKGFEKILMASVDPLVEMCQKMTDLNVSKVPANDSWNNHIFLLNCLTYLQELLMPFSFTAERVASLGTLLDEHVKALVNQHYRQFLGESGLDEVIEAIQSKPDQTPLSHTDNASGKAVATSLSRFSTFLTGIDVVSSPKLLQLSVPRLASEVHREALRQLGFAYETICSEVKKPENKFEFVSTLLGSQKPFGQMNTLWQILGIPEDSVLY